MASIDPDRQADCHASGSVPIAAFAINEMREVALCGHHVNKGRKTLEEAGWLIVPFGTLDPGTGVGTEATKQHYAISGEAP